MPQNMKMEEYIQGAASVAIAPRRFIAFNKTTMAVTYPAAGALADGISIGAAAIGEKIQFIPLGSTFHGVYEVEAGGNILVGANIVTDASGRAVTGVATNKRLGFAYEAAVVDQIACIYNLTTVGETL